MVKTKETVGDRVSGLRYVGNGVYIMGVPARDLTPAEVIEHADVISIQESVTGLRIYEPVELATT